MKEAAVERAVWRTLFWKGLWTCRKTDNGVNECMTSWREEEEEEIVEEEKEVEGGGEEEEEVEGGGGEEEVEEEEEEEEDEEEEDEKKEEEKAGLRSFDFMVSGVTRNMVRYFDGLLGRG